MKEYFNPPTQDQKQSMAKYHLSFQKRNFNLFNFMARIRKQKGYFPPVEFLLKTCASAMKSDTPNLWGYFTKALKEELPKAFADLNIKQAQEYKKEPLTKIADLLKGA